MPEYATAGKISPILTELITHTGAELVSGTLSETGLDSPSGRIEPNAEAMESDFQKLGLYSRFVDPDSRSIIAETQLAAAFVQGIGSRDYELIDITKKKEEKK